MSPVTLDSNIITSASFNNYLSSATPATSYAGSQILTTGTSIAR